MRYTITLDIELPDTPCGWDPTAFLAEAYFTRTYGADLASALAERREGTLAEAIVDWLTFGDGSPFDGIVEDYRSVVGIAHKDGRIAAVHRLPGQADAASVFGATQTYAVNQSDAANTTV